MKTQPISDYLNLSFFILIALFFFTTNSPKALAQATLFSGTSTPDIKVKTNLNDTIYNLLSFLKLDFFPKENSPRESIAINSLKNAIVKINGQTTKLDHAIPRGSNKQVPDVIDKFEWPLKLKEGLNEIKVRAYNNTSHLDTTIFITYINPARTPTLHLLLIGNDYENQSQITSLPYTRNSVESIQKTFERSYHQSVSTTVLFNEEATKANIEDAMQQFSQQANENDIVAIYFAAHANPEAIVLAESTNVHDTDRTRTISQNDLKTFVQDLPCKTLLMLDVCNSSQLMPNTDPIYNESISIEGYEKNDPTDYLVKYPSAKMVISAAKNISYETHDLKNSIFATTFKKMFQNKAGDDNNDGYISFGEMKEYLTQQIEKLAEEQGKEQSPDFYPKEQGDLDHIPILETSN